MVRAAESYVPLLIATLERFGIPARFYFDSKLEEHVVTRYLCGAVDAMLGGWDHEQTLAVLRLAPRFADSRAMDEFDFAVREQIPNAGLGALKALLVDAEGKPRTEGAERLLHKIEILGALEEWRSFSLTPRDWAARLRTLRNVFRPPQFADRIGHEEALLWRSQAAVLDLFDQAVDEAAVALAGGKGDGAVDLPEFWRAVKAVLRLTPLRFRDGRRNVVHVLSAHEARQWVLPVVFVCGMVEKQFPRVHQQDAFFSDAARSKLNASGVRVRTAAEFEREERALFESAISRATHAGNAVLSEFDARGERNLPSIYLEGLPLVAQEARAVRPLPGIFHFRGVRPRIHAPRLLEYLRERSRAALAHAAGNLSAVSVPVLRRADFTPDHDAAATGAPSRLPGAGNYRARGAGHVVRRRARKSAHCSRASSSAFAKSRASLCYHTERLRNAMLDDLRGFAADGRWPRGEFQSQMEKEFQVRRWTIRWRSRARSIASIRRPTAAPT